VVQLVSAVGGGKLTRELALDTLAADLNAVESRYDPDHYHGIVARFSPDGPTVLIYRSGSFSISGAESLTELSETRSKLESEFTRLFDQYQYETPFRVHNLVHRAKVPVDEFGGSANLNTLAIGFGLKHVEYEPEQFPGMIYRPPEDNAVYLIFASGALVATGHTCSEHARRGIDSVIGGISDILQTP